MQTIDLTVRNPSGLHARPAATFVKAASAFKSKITVENITRGTAPGDAKSFLKVITHGAVKGHVIRLTIDGEDEDSAAKTLGDLVASGMGEAVD
jgi:phosphotransferase system HPr (HPr) family protein